MGVWIKLFQNRLVSTWLISYLVNGLHFKDVVSDQRTTIIEWRFKDESSTGRSDLDSLQVIRRKRHLFSEGKNNDESI